MATYAKGGGLPTAVSAFAHTGDYLSSAYEQSTGRGGDAGSAIPAHFRADASSSSSASSTAAASEFSRFTSYADSHASAAPFLLAHAELTPRTRLDPASADSELAAIAALSPSASSAIANSLADGHAVFALLNGEDSLVDAVAGDWESEMWQQRAHFRDTASLPSDPLASKSCTRGPRSTTTTSSSNKADDSPTATAGDMSPTSRSLLDSLSHLSLAERTYLRTLLASQDPATMFEDYFSHGSYTEDVWTPPEYVKGLLDRAVAAGEGKGKEREKERERQDDAGKAKAVRRLEMVLRHLDGQLGGQAPATSTTSSQGQGGSWARELQGNGTTSSSSAAALSSASAQDTAGIHAYRSHVMAQHDYSPAATYAPSSLSSSAFVSFSPPVAAPPSSSTRTPSSASTTAPPAFRRADSYTPSEAESTRSDSSYEEYVKEKEARMRSNEGGRFGPDFSTRLPQHVAVSETGGAGYGEERMEVKEGRTH
ncbi:hypothetical protein JCM10908_006906 [Rhodotorula pacifica]|uniref:uncharacterized protein n=1 Tax=Rhodotorula pacifica TaxID=1495444 RepID=UPI0031822726